MSLQPHSKSSIHKESGIAAILLVLVLMFFISAIFAGIIARMSLVSHQAVQQAKTRYLHNAQTQLSHWYSENAAALDAGGDNSSSPYSASEIMAQAGIQQQWNAQLFVSHEQCITANTSQGNKLCYRTLWFAIPSTAGHPPILQMGSVFMPFNATYVSVSGLTIETALYNQALTQISEMGDLLESMFAASTASGGVHDANLDWYAPQGQNCGNGSGPWATCGTYPWSAYIQNSGIAGSNGKNPWDLQVMVNDSTQPASNTAPPYTVELQSPLPWGGNISELITQPM